MVEVQLKILSMMKKYKLLLFLLLGFFSCNDTESFFEASNNDLKLDYRAVPGGAMLRYTLPNNREIFSMNIRYNNNRGLPILKSCGYGGDSVLLDGFTKSQNASAQITFVDNYGKESKPFDFEFSTEDSSPWTFFDNMEVKPSWDGFEVIYGKTSLATGMAHIFYLGTNPLTQKPDTVLMTSFPINAKGDTLRLVVEQETIKNTVIIRTEDFGGYRVRQEIYRDIESFVAEKYTITKNNFNDGGISVESVKCKTGVEYLFDGELKGSYRFLAPLPPMPNIPIEIFGVYLAGPNAFSEENPKPFIIDLKEGKIPAKIKLFSIQKFPSARFGPPSGAYEQGALWNGKYNDKVPCKAVIYATNDLSNESEWTKIGTLDEDPKATYPWFLPRGTVDITTVEKLEKSDPISVDIYFPAGNISYRYLIVKFNDTFDIPKDDVNYNQNKYITLTELEVYVKKNNL